MVRVVKVRIYQSLLGHRRQIVAAARPEERIVFGEQAGFELKERLQGGDPKLVQNPVDFSGSDVGLPIVQAVSQDQSTVLGKGVQYFDGLRAHTTIMPRLTKRSHRPVDPCRLSDRRDTLEELLETVGESPVVVQLVVEKSGETENGWAAHGVRSDEDIELVLLP